MLESYMDLFRDDSVPDLLVDYNSDGPGIDVKGSYDTAVVVFVRYTFVDGSIDYNVNDVVDFVGGEGLGDVDDSVLLESLFEFVPAFHLKP